MEATDVQLAGIRYMNALLAETAAIRAMTRLLEKQAETAVYGQGKSFEREMQEQQEMYQLALAERRRALANWQRLGGTQMETSTQEGVSDGNQDAVCQEQE